ncbi:hypothetical protein D9M72_498300 [compost metagenome]
MSVRQRQPHRDTRARPEWPAFSDQLCCIDTKHQTIARLVGVRAALDHDVVVGALRMGQESDAPVRSSGSCPDELGGLGVEWIGPDGLRVWIQGDELNLVDPWIEARNRAGDLEEQVMPAPFGCDGNGRQRGQVRIMLIGPLGGQAMEERALLLKFGNQRLPFPDHQHASTDKQEETPKDGQIEGAFEDRAIAVYHRFSGLVVIRCLEQRAVAGQARSCSPRSSRR